MDRNASQEINNVIPRNEVPEGLKALKSAAEGYKHYIKYLKNGGADGLSPEFPELQIVEAA